jgi:hypothetical protein
MNIKMKIRSKSNKIKSSEIDDVEQIKVRNTVRRNHVFIVPVITIRQRQNIFCGTFVFLTDKAEEYSGNSFVTPSQKNEYGSAKRKAVK